MYLESNVAALGRQRLADGPVLSPRLRRAVRRPVVRTALSTFYGPFRCASLCPGLPGCRDCSHSATEIKVDAEHAARMPETPSLSCRCSIGGMPSKVSVKCAIPGCHRRLKMTLAEREELRLVGRENNATAGARMPRPREGRLQLRIRRYRHRCPAGGTPGRGIQGNSPLARDADPAARGGG